MHCQLKKLLTVRQNNSPCQFLSKYRENSMENMNSDLRV